MSFSSKNLADSEKTLIFAAEKVKEGDNGIPTERKVGILSFLPTQINRNCK